MKIYLLIFLLLGYLKSFSQEERLHAWKEDIEFLIKELPEKHKELFFSMSKEDYESSLRNISNKVNELNDFGIATKIQQIIAKIGDSHTNVRYENLINPSKTLPYNLYWFSDGIFFLNGKYENEILTGKKIAKINGYDIERVLDSISTLITIDNQSVLKNFGPNFLKYTQFLEYFKFIENNRITFELESLNGELFNYVIDIDSVLNIKSNKISLDSLPFSWKGKDKYFNEFYFEDNNILYVQYNICWSRELELSIGHKKRALSIPSFEEFEKRVFEIIESKPIDKLVFDIRFNMGGSSPQGTEFIRKLSKIKTINKKGNLFVIIGRQTASSAIINAMDFKKYTKAIFVGEEPSQKPNHYGEVRSFKLPNSGLIIQYSTKYIKTSNNDLNNFIPDITVKTRYLDYSKGIDPEFQEILNYK